MEDNPGDQKANSESNKSTGGQDSGPGSCTTTHVSCGNNSCDTASIKCKIDESFHIKEEIVQDAERDYDETLEIKEEVLLDQQIKIESKESTESQIAGRSYYTPMYISFDNNSSAKTKSKYNIDENLDIKEEIVPERHQWEKYNLRSERNQFDEKCIITEISSDNNSGFKTKIEYNNDETLEIKEEAVQDHGNVEQKCDLKLRILDTREADIMTVKEPGTSKMKKLEEPKSKPKKKYSCEKCGRKYAQKRTLHAHKKFECGVVPQFVCNFCGKLFKRKSQVNSHSRRMHQKRDSKISQTRHNCDKCSRTYSSLSALNDHKRAEHAVVLPQFICDYCHFQTKRKRYLSKHITWQHLDS